MEKLIIYVCPGSPDYANPKYPGIPKSWDALVEEAVACREAGASIIHLHGPQEANGRLIPDGWGKRLRSFAADEVSATAEAFSPPSLQLALATLVAVTSPATAAPTSAVASFM